MSSTPRSGGSGGQPPLPTSIGKYKVLERIGRGAMGVVYSARDEIMDRVVALKVMAGDLEAEPDTRARFYREAKVGGQLLHRNITTVFDLGESDGRLFMVMELLRGLPLNQFLSRPEGVSLEIKLDLMIQLCEGLAAAHAHGVFHRDIKPSNLYVLDDGTLKILDFGIARLATSTMTATGSIVGTPDYMSPEQTVGGEIDQRSDIFSAGALFYAMLSGNKPFASPDLPTVLRKVQKEDPPPITAPDMPAALVHIVMKALAKKKEDRPQTARELAAALGQFRREWEAEARTIAERAHGVYKTIESLLEEQLHTAERLGLEKPVLPDPVLASIQDEYPIVADRGPDALLRIPFKRDVISAIAAKLDARRGELEAAVNKLHLASLAAPATIVMAPAREPASPPRREPAPRVLVPTSDDIDQATVILNSARSTTPASRQAGLGKPGPSGAAAPGGVQSDGVQQLLAAAAQARTERNWARVLDLARQLSAFDRADPRFSALREEAEAGLEQERAARQQALTAAIADLRRAIQAGRFSEAEAHLVRAGAHAQELGTPAAREQVASMQGSLERARRSFAELARAQSLFDAGQRREAIDALRSLLAGDPEASGVRAAVERLSAEAERLAEAERRQAQIAAHLAAAEQAWINGDDPRTREEAAAALAIEPAHDRAAELLIDASVRARQAAAHDARLADAKAALAETRTLIEQSDWARAASRAATAAIVPETAAAGRSLLLEVLQHESDQRIENLRSRVERDRRREADRLLTNARAALRARDWGGARAAAEDILTGDPRHAEARSLYRHAMLGTSPPPAAPVQQEARPIARVPIEEGDDAATLPVPRIVLPQPGPAPARPQAVPAAPPAAPKPAAEAPPASPQGGSVLSKFKPWVTRGKSKGDA
jgi:hypothetical protein